ncbi:uncharacterized protein BYT42DRAFT_530794 [Radiomyces spectabilis]|uniref:uncharacterized protein n=1 Tax=Radiomyces spectabilis TaxID=64574 RepID=UPI00221EB2CB|nr:uncharacterized protein BYT42DRAFT_530794 [Radiomyces spectabilis]KAI8381111.1 hypothetical protein BYT42DRAFT_530794 [Radiomyces spectabilis]
MDLTQNNETLAPPIELGVSRPTVTIPMKPIPSSSSPSYAVAPSSSTMHAIQNIYTTTFSLVGTEFLQRLVQELARWIKVPTVLLLQLITLDEYKDSSLEEEFKLVSEQGIAHHTNKYPLHSPTGLSVSESCYDTDQSQRFMSDGYSNSSALSNQLFLTRASYATSDTETLQPCTAIPLSLLQDGPHIKTLIDGSCCITEHAMQSCSVYGTYHGFAGVRLEIPSEDGSSETLGVLCVMNDHPMSEEDLRTTFNLFDALKERCARELERIREAERLIQAKNAATLDAENKIKFLADMSHEIRTPMNAVIALTDLLLQERSTLNEEQAEHLEVIQTSGHHLLTIINDILDISKLNHNPNFKLESRRFSLRKCVKDTLNMARHQASMSQQNKIVYVTECPMDISDSMPLPQVIAHLEKTGVLCPSQIQHKGKTLLPLIWKIDNDIPDYLMGDTMRLTQIMLNLCSNAVKFTKHGGIRIRIKRYVPTPAQSSSQQPTRMTFKQRYDAKIETIWTQAMRGKKKGGDAGAGASDDEENAQAEKAILEISVTDTGIGIPADRLPKLFKSFSQIDISTARRYGGTGLGLAISSTLVNHMGGGLWVESEEGVGSRFALTLPMTIASRPPMESRTNTDTSGGNCITSPPSPSSTASDGSSSVHSNLGDRMNDNMLSFHSTTSSTAPPSHLSSYFPPMMSSSLVNNSGHTRAKIQQSQLPYSCLSARQQQQQQPSPPSVTSPASPQMPQQFSPPSEPGTRSTLSLQAFGNSREHAWGSQSQLSIPSIAPTTPLPVTHSSHGYASDKKMGMRPPASAPDSQLNSTKMNTDLLSLPSMPRSGRIVTTKYNHHRKPASKEENLAKLYPIKIMLAEDNVLNQKIAISILKRLGYQDVTLANNGREVLELMRKTKFDLIFMDLYMPEMDGLEATRVIVSERKKITCSPQHTSGPAEESPLLNAAEVYIIALTASASRQDRQICIDAGMNDFISKPFTMLEMKSSLKNCVSKRKKRRKQQSKDHKDMLEDDPMVGVEETRPNDESNADSPISNLGSPSSSNSINDR